MWKDRFTGWIWRNPILAAVALCVVAFLTADGLTQAIAEKHLIAVFRESNANVNAAGGLWILAAAMATGLVVALALALAGGVVCFRREAQEIRSAYETLLQRLEASKRALDEAQDERESLRGQLGRVVSELAKCSVELAKTKLGALASRQQKSVLVRYVDQNDNELAEAIASTFQVAGWPASVDRHSGHFRQQTPHRIVFGSGDPDVAKELALIFTSGHLINEAVSPCEYLEHQTGDKAVAVMIFPRKAGAQA